MSGRCSHLVLVLLLFRSIGAAIGFDEIRSQARDLALHPFQPLMKHLPESLGDLSYDQYQAIKFDFKKALWRDQKLPFQIEFFPPGGNHKSGVMFNEIVGQTVNALPFRPDFFQWGTNRWQYSPDLGYAGFRVTHPQKNFGEVAVFLDASYFRMVGRGQVYGTWARGLALNTTLRQDEEFPIFRQFWIRRPEKADKDITVYALLDGPSVTGAYQFVIRAGTETVATVKASLFPRREVKEFGIAPLTSMFLRDERGRPGLNDSRPEVHDADGLLLHTRTGEWIWRPLEAGKMMRVNAYQDEDPQGFGLLQRDRQYEHYQDTGARYHKRPSVWVRPLGNWGKGAVELVQLPSNEEYWDNIVAFWVPATTPAVGSELEVEYELRWTLAEISAGNLGRVQATQAGLVDAGNESSNLRFIVDFAGKAIESLPATEKLTSEIHCDNEVKIADSSVVWNKGNHTWRLVIEVANPHKAMDLRACLKRAEVPVTETWTYTWQP